MTCEHYQLQTSALLDGELPPARTEQLFTHLAECDACRTFLAALTSLNAQVESRFRATQSVLPSDSPHAAPGQPWMRQLWQRRVSVRLSVAAAIVLLAAGGLFWSLATRGTQMQPQRVYVSTLPVVEVVAD